MTTQKDYHVDALISGVFIDYSPQGLVAEQFLPIVPVVFETGKYPIWTKEDQLRVPTKTQRADGAPSIRVDFGASTGTYSANAFALSVAITDRQRRNSDDQFRLETVKTRGVARLIKLDLEVRIANLRSSASIPAGHKKTLSGTGQWADSLGVEGTTSNPELEIDLGVNKILEDTGGFTPNIIIMPYNVALAVSRHSKITAKLQYNPTPWDTLIRGGYLPSEFKGMKVLIPKAFRVTSIEGAATSVIASVWGKDVVLAYTSALPDLDAPSFGYIPRTVERVNAWREDPIQSDIFEPEEIEDTVITDGNCAYVIINAIA